MRIKAIFFIIFLGSCAAGETITLERAREALKRSVSFFRAEAAHGGAYVYRISDDLSLREGEGKAKRTTGWLEPPGTPAVGSAYIDAYQFTGDDFLLEAALETADALRRTQLRSGGWNDQIEFAPEDRQDYAYRVDKHVGKRDTSTLDDNKTQSAIHFLIRLDHTTDKKHQWLGEMIAYALERIIKAQYSNGAWPQRFSGPSSTGPIEITNASYPKSWARSYPRRKYSHFFTLNDNTMTDTIGLMLIAYDVYGDEEYAKAARSGGEFLLCAQLPLPQPGWAQQYDQNMQPVWARKFEPPAITGGESQGVMKCLLKLYERFGDSKYLAAVGRGLAYYQTCVRADGKLARFYELRTNRPLYFTRDYELTYDDSDMPTHYAFVVTSRLNQIRDTYKRLSSVDIAQRLLPVRQAPPVATFKGGQRVVDDATEALNSLDDRGAWVTPGSMRNYPDSGVTRTIESKVFMRQMLALAQYIHVLQTSN